MVSILILSSHLLPSLSTGSFLEVPSAESKMYLWTYYWKTKFFIERLKTLFTRMQADYTFPEKIHYISVTLPPKHQTSLNEKPFILVLATQVQSRLSICTLNKPQSWCNSTPNNNKVKCISITILIFIEDNGNVLNFCPKKFKF